MTIAGVGVDSPILIIPFGVAFSQVFAFERLVSRLNEMQSKEYLDSLKLQRHKSNIDEANDAYDLGVGEETTTEDEALLHLPDQPRPANGRAGSAPSSTSRK